MKSMVCTKPFSLEYQNRPEPEWRPGQTLLKIMRVGICGTDLHAFEGTQPFFDYPRVMGHEMGAEILKTDAPGFTENEKVTCIPYFHCGHCKACRTGKPNCCVSLQVAGVHIDGGLADILLVPSTSLVRAASLSLDELALVEPLAIGAHAVRRAGVKPREWVLVIGAGPIGIAVMEFARMAGARVILMDVNSSRLRFCEQQLQVEHALPAENAQQQVRELTQGDMPDVVFDATGNLGAIRDAFSFLSHGGRFVLVGLQREEIPFSHPEFHKREAALMSSRNATRADFEEVVKSIQERKINPRDYITHRLEFYQASDQFRGLTDPASGVVKAIITIN